MDTEKRTIQMYNPKGVFDEGGKGRKPCNCGKFVASRTKSCPVCHFEFQPAQKASSSSSSSSSSSPSSSSSSTAKTSDVKPVEKFDRLTKIDAPAGLCPVKLGGITASITNPKNEPITAEELEEWLDQVLAEGEINHIRYSPIALKYFLRQYYEIYSPLWFEAASMLDNLLYAEGTFVEAFEND